MLHRLPRQLPPLELMLEDLGNPPAPVLAAAFGVSVRTVFRWQVGDWPRAALLCLFFASRWGWSAVECDALHALNTSAALSRALRDELEQVRAQLARVEALGDFGAANSPVLSSTIAVARRPLARDPGARRRPLPDDERAEQRAPNHNARFHQHGRRKFRR